MTEEEEIILHIQKDGFTLCINCIEVLRNKIKADKAIPYLPLDFLVKELKRIRKEIYDNEKQKNQPKKLSCENEVLQ